MQSLAPRSTSMSTVCMMQNPSMSMPILQIVTISITSNPIVWRSPDERSMRMPHLLRSTPRSSVVSLNVREPISHVNACASLQVHSPLTQPLYQGLSNCSTRVRSGQAAHLRCSSYSAHASRYRPLGMSARARHSVAWLQFSWKSFPACTPKIEFFPSEGSKGGFFVRSEIVLRWLGPRSHLLS
jgi:hypothetical protein